MPTLQIKNPWIVRFIERPEATMRLFCFTHAGGGTAGYRNWAKQLPPTIEVNAIRLPQREARLRETLDTDWSRLIPQIVAALPTDKPYALFGHSLGSLVAFEVARTLQQNAFVQQPIALFASARSAPDLAATFTAIHDLSDGELVEHIQTRYGGIPQVIVQTPSLLELFLPTLRADFTLLEKYRYQPSEPLDCHVVALGGRDDYVTRDELAAWGEHGSAEFNLHLFEGGHFYLDAQRTAVLDTIARYLI